jgi:hypothetical protein
VAKYSKWTPEEDRRLLELHEAGRSRVRIAAALGRTTGSVQSRLYKLTSIKVEVAPMASS